MKMIKFTSLVIALVMGSLMGQAAVASIPLVRDSISNMQGCNLALTGSIPAAEWAKTLESNPELNALNQLFQTRQLTHPEFMSRFELETFKQILSDPEMMFFQQRLNTYLTALKDVPDSASQLAKVFEERLVDEVPLVSIKKRVEDFLTPNASQDRFLVLRQFLGENSLSDMQLLVHGGDPFRPTPESLLGKYLSESKAQTVVRKFRTTDVLTEPFNGLDRMVIAISQETWPIYQKYFTKINFLIHTHSPGQGTLYIASNGKRGSYGALSSELLGFGSNTSALMPHVLLSTTEGQRLQQYSKLASISNSYSNYPWLRRGYCLTGGYSSCTHWVGNLPLGDEFVDLLKLPGNVDQHAGNALSAEPQIGPVSHDWINSVVKLEGHNPPVYSVTSNQGRTNNLTEEKLSLMQRVWRTPSRMQLSEMLGPEELAANLRGEYANPGWVAIRLTAHVKQERMPFVFYIVPDASAPITTDFDPQISAY